MLSLAAARALTLVSLLMLGACSSAPGPRDGVEGPQDGEVDDSGQLPAEGASTTDGAFFDAGGAHDAGGDDVPTSVDGAAGDARTAGRADAELGARDGGSGGSSDTASADAGDAAIKPAPADAALPGDTGATHPFGSHPQVYPTGSILPRGDRAALDQAVRDQYAQWRRAYLRHDCNGYYVAVNEPGSANTFVTDSEAHGYGMLITALMAGAEPDARTIFDGFVRLYRATPSINDHDLMGWGIDRNCQPVVNDDSATDGDEDIAFALLLAEQQWGDRGQYDYGAEARRSIAAIRAHEINPTTNLPLLGDWSKPDDAVFYWITRPSDFMPDHYRAFAAAMPGTSWVASTDAVYKLVQYTQYTLAPSTGLVPDFIKDTNTTTPHVVPISFANDPIYLGEALHAEYDYNSCRVPWRLGTDYVVSGSANTRLALGRINTFIRATTGDDPTKIVDGYSLAGVSPAGAGPNDCFTAGFGVAALVDVDNQAWLDAIWAQLAARPVTDYYQDTVRLLAMIVMSGNWWAPN